MVGIFAKMQDYPTLHAKTEPHTETACNLSWDFCESLDIPETLKEAIRQLGSKACGKITRR